MTSFDVEVWTANLGRGVGDPVLEADMDALLAKMPEDLPWILGLQELDEADGPEEHKELLERLVASKARGRTIFSAGWRQAVPVLSHGLRMRWAHVFPACKGLPKITPHRVLVEAHYDPLVEGGPEHAHLNLHLPRDLPVTRSRRRACRRVARRRVRANRREGRTVTLTADSNSYGHGFLRLVRPYRAVEDGIDKVYAWAPRGWKVHRIGAPLRLQLHIDRHDARGARLRFTSR